MQFDRAHILHALAAVEPQRSCGRNIAHGARVVREGVRMRPALHTLIRANMCERERKKLSLCVCGVQQAAILRPFVLSIILLFDVAVVEASESE